MGKPSKEQIEFARGMTTRQRGTLRVLAMYPCHLSASERGDRELYALIRNKLAQCFPTAPGSQGAFMWEATAAGKAIDAMIRKGEL